MRDMRISVVGALAAAASLPAAMASIARPRIQQRNGTAVNGVVHIMNAEPELPHDDDATPYCTWWLDNYGSEVCEDIPDWWGISMEDFVRWNPSVKDDCSGFASGKSYCVEAVGEPPVATTQPPVTAPPTSITTATATATSTQSGNGIETPQPIQPGMVDNCNRFYFVEAGDGCSAIASQHGIAFADLLRWNPQIGSDCSGLWAEVNVCVGVVGFTATATATQTTEPTPTNGIPTPSPTQPGMVGNCDAFHQVASGDSCAAIAGQYGISLAQFAQWNTEVGTDCAGLWLDYYVCVSVVGVEPTRTTTTEPSPTNGIATPTPIEPGMVDNCDAFHKVVSGDTCQAIARTYGISTAQLAQWNAQVGADCAGLWLDYYVCVSVVGAEPTRTTTTTTGSGNGVATPTPTQAGMVGSCDTFRYVVQGDTCDSLARLAGVPTQIFISWNPAVKSDCTGLWLDTYCCIGLI